MNTFVKGALIASRTPAFCIIGLAAYSITAAVSAEPKKKPNILWVITDDQRMDSVPAFNRITHGKDESELGKVISPNVDRLAATGVTFINTFNQNPSCAPSRANMHTGRYSHRTGVYGFEYYKPKGMEHWHRTIPEVLREDAGYQSVSAGKTGLYYREVKPVRKRINMLYDVDLGYRREFAPKDLYDWNPSQRDKRRKRSEYFQFPNGEVLEWPAHPGEDAKDMAELKERLDIFRHYTRTKKDPGKMILGGLNPQTKDKTRDAWFVAELDNYLKHADQKYTTHTGMKMKGPDSTKPLFAYIGFETPHTPVLPPKEFRDKFKNIKYKIPEVSKKEIKSFPPQIKKLYKNNASDHFTNAEKQQMIADYYAFCAYADYLTGKAVDSFVEYSEKTDSPWMVLYVCGDHGWRLNEHGMVAKFGPYDLDLRDPIVVVSSDKKKFPAGKVVKDFTQFVDMAPTFLAAAGIDVTKPTFDYLDGQDLAKVAHGKLRPRDYVIAEPTPVTGPRAVIRTKDYKFSMKIRPKKMDGKNIEWAIKADLKKVEPMFFDLRNDPKEINNRAFDSYYRPVIDALREKLQNIVLGDGRVEVAWNKKGISQGVVHSNFAPGADDGKIKLPKLNPRK